MPYIKKNQREALDVDHVRPGSPGELNYVFTMIAIRYMSNHGLSYQHINDILGALEGAKLEFYRRVATPYEERKMVANGDVY